MPDVVEILITSYMAKRSVSPPGIPLF